MNPEGQFKASLGFAAFIAFAWLCLQLLLDPIRYYFLADFTAAFARIFFPLFIILLVVCLAAQRWTAFRQEDRGADFAAGASSKYARAVSILPAPLALLSGLTAFFIRYVIFRSDYLYLGYIPRILMAYAGLIIAGFVAIKALRHRRWELGFLLVLALTSALLRLGFASHLATQNYFHPGPRGGKSGPPPIILITIDTLRRDSLSCYDQAVQYTPNIGELAKESAVFERHYTVAPWTLPSLASLMTGLPPQTHQAVTHGSRLADGFTTLAEHLRGAGYLTAAFVDSICLYSRHNLKQGFGCYENIISYPAQYPHRGWINPNPWSAHYNRWRSTESLARLGGAWADAHRNARFFLWIHYLDPHAPYEPVSPIHPEERVETRLGDSFEDVSGLREQGANMGEDDRKWLRTLYNHEVEDVDRSLGKLFTRLRELRLFEDSLIILTSDHGEEFWDHGSCEHGHTLYDELIHIPLVVKLPGAHQTRRVGGMTDQMDLLPTVLDLCGVKFDETKIMGRSYAGILRGEGPERNEQPSVASSILHGTNKICAVSEGHKYTQSLEGNPESLFDLVNDPAERNSVLDAQPDRAMRMKSEIERYLARAAELKNAYGIKEGEQVPIDEPSIERMKALGYLK